MQAKIFSGSGETTTYDALTTAGTEADPGTGTFNDGDAIAFIWYVEAATCSGCTHNYLVVESDDTIDASLPTGSWIRETSALTDVTGSTYSSHYYSEQSNYSDTDRATASDGEIWSDVSTLQ